MPIQFDHVVFFVEDLHIAVKDFQEIGFHVVYGGSHPMWGTYNALIYVGDVYIELIAIEKEEIFEIASKQPYTLHQTYEKKNRQNGITQIALRTADAKQTANILIDANFDVHGPTKFSRKTPAGELIEWELVHTGKKNNKDVLPFIIDWKQPHERRIKKLKDQGVIANHANGVKEITSIVLVAQDLRYINSLFQALQIPTSFEESKLQVYLDNVLLYFTQDDLSSIVFAGEKLTENIIYESSNIKFKRKIED